MVELMFMFEIKFNHSTIKYFDSKTILPPQNCPLACSTPSASIERAKVAIWVLQEISCPDNRVLVWFVNSSVFQIIDSNFHSHFWKFIWILFRFHLKIWAIVCRNRLNWLKRRHWRTVSFDFSLTKHDLQFRLSPDKYCFRGEQQVYLTSPVTQSSSGKSEDSCRQFATGKIKSHGLQLALLLIRICPQCLRLKAKGFCRNLAKFPIRWATKSGPARNVSFKEKHWNLLAASQAIQLFIRFIRVMHRVMRHIPDALFTWF